MVTASHNLEPVSVQHVSMPKATHLRTTQDNGVKIVDPCSEMLELSWESHATVLANASSTGGLISALLHDLIKTAEIAISELARVVYARDTRPSGPALVAALEDGLMAMGAEARNAGVITAPMIHYLVRAINTKGTKDSYGDDTEEGYYTKFSSAFNELIVRASIYLFRAFA